MTEPIRIKKEGGIVEVLLNRPEAFNAFDLEMIELLEKCLISLAMDDSVSVLIISGEGKAFCAGGDLRWALELSWWTCGSFPRIGRSLPSSHIRNSSNEEAGYSGCEWDSGRGWFFPGPGLRLSSHGSIRQTTARLYFERSMY